MTVWERENWDDEVSMQRLTKNIDFCVDFKMYLGVKKMTLHDTASGYLCIIDNCLLLVRCLPKSTETARKGLKKVMVLFVTLANQASFIKLHLW